MFTDDFEDNILLGNHFTGVRDVQDVTGLVKEGLAIKDAPWLYEDIGKNRTIGLLFFNPSLRTLLSSQKAAYNLGMSVIVLNVNSEGWNLEFEEGAVMDGDNQEHIKDAVAVISNYCDIIGVRCFAGLKDREADYEEKILNQFLGYSRAPVMSLESATRHPLQSLADMMTIREHKQSESPKIVLSWAPHPKALPQAVPNSFLEWTLAAGMDVTVTHPKGYELANQFTKGAKIEYDQNKALQDADFVYVKNWSSYQEYGQVKQKSRDWAITNQKMALTNEGKFMHCLPIRRNVVADDDVVDSPRSLVLQQAENRVFATQAVLKQMINNLEGNE